MKGSRGLQRTHSRAGSKVREKVAEVIEAEGEDSRLHEAASERTAVSEAVMERIRKALALGLHQGGNIAERQHAMQRATRLMQQYGITHAGTALFRGGHMHCNLPSAGMLCTGSTSGYFSALLILGWRYAACCWLRIRCLVTVRTIAHWHCSKAKQCLIVCCNLAILRRRMYLKRQC